MSRMSTLKRENISIGRELESRYDHVKIVADNIDVVSRYLGSLGGHPTLRPDKSELRNGDYYLNVVGSPEEHEIYYYSMPANSWVAMHASGSDSEHIAAARVGGGGLLVGDVENHLQDSEDYVVIAAGSVPAMTMCNIVLSEAFKTSRPSVTLTGGDSVFSGDRNDSVISFQGPARLQLTSDGVSKWNLEVIKGGIAYD